jgi:hypothetical protein
MTSSGLQKERVIHVFAEHRSESYGHGQVQTRAELISTAAAAIGSAAERQHVVHESYTHYAPRKIMPRRATAASTA